MTNTTKIQKILPWTVFVLVIIVPTLFWLDRYNWSLNYLTISTLFPLLGIWAWSIMWTHYFLGGVRILTGSEKNQRYAIITDYLVLLLIILHPALLAWQQWQNTQALPPISFYNYVSSSMKAFILLGSVSLLLFISYDLLVRLKKKPIVKRNWRWVSLSQAMAMLFIFIHAIAIGNLTNNNAYELYWILLGVSLIPMTGLILRNDWQK